MRAGDSRFRQLAARKRMRLASAVLPMVLGMAIPLLATTMSAPPARGEQPPTGHQWALMVGRNEAANAGTGAQKELVQLLEGAFGYKDGYITQLYNEDTTRPRILSALGAVRDKMQARDTVFVFLDLPLVGSDNQLGNLMVPAGAALSSPWTLLGPTDVIKALVGTPARAVFVVLPACSEQAVPVDILMTRGGPALALMTVCPASATVPSTFADTFVTVLRMASPSQRLTPTDLADGIRARGFYFCRSGALSTIPLFFPSRKSGAGYATTSARSARHAPPKTRCKPSSPSRKRPCPRLGRVRPS